MFIASANSVSLTDVTASNNTNNGARICANVVAVNDSTFAANSNYGLSVITDAFTQSGNTYTDNGAGDFFQGSGVCIPLTTNDNNGGNNGGNNECWCVKPSDTPDVSENPAH